MIKQAKAEETALREKERNFCYRASYETILGSLETLERFKDDSEVVCSTSYPGFTGEVFR